MIDPMTTLDGKLNREGLRVEDVEHILANIARREELALTQCPLNNKTLAALCDLALTALRPSSGDAVEAGRAEVEQARAMALEQGYDLFAPFATPVSVDVDRHGVVVIRDADGGNLMDFNTHTQLPLNNEALQEAEKLFWTGEAKRIAAAINAALPPVSGGDAVEAGEHGKLLLDSVREQVEEAALSGRDGVWLTCSGCADSAEGVLDSRAYPFVEAFGCQLGAGCHECGGIGAVWDTTNWDDFGQSMLSAEASPPAEIRPEAGERVTDEMVQAALASSPQFPGQRLVGSVREMMSFGYGTPNPKAYMRAALEAALKSLPSAGNKTQGGEA